MIEIDSIRFSVFLAAAVLLAISPGPGVTYVFARTAAGGRREGIASSLGTAAGGLVHVAGAALGLSLLIAESAMLFSILKYAGACYLVYLGARMLLNRTPARANVKVRAAGTSRAFWEGVAVETFNVKTALFFLAFIPQFVNPAAAPFGQFVLLGAICVALNTTVDLLAVLGAAYLLRSAATQGLRSRLLSVSSGVTLIGLGAYVALVEHER